MLPMFFVLCINALFMQTLGPLKRLVFMPADRDTVDCQQKLCQTIGGASQQSSACSGLTQDGNHEFVSRRSIRELQSQELPAHAANSTLCQQCCSVEIFKLQHNPVLACRFRGLLVCCTFSCAVSQQAGSVGIHLKMHMFPPTPLADRQPGSPPLGFAAPCRVADTCRP